MVIAHDAGNSPHKYALPVCSRSEQEKQRMLYRQSSECITNHSTEKKLKTKITCSDLIEKGDPQRTLAARSHFGHFGNVMCRIVWQHLKRIKIKRSGRSVKQSGVYI